METNNSPTRRASLRRAIVKGFRDSYDHLGYVVFVSFIGFFIMALLATGAVGLSRLVHAGIELKVTLALIVMLVGWLFSTGIFYYVNKSVFGEHPSYSDILVGIRQLILPSLGLFFLDVIASVIVVGDTAFFIVMILQKGNISLAILGAISGYVMLVWFLMMMYHLPLLVAQLGMESGARVKVVLRKSFLLVADNPIFTVGLFLVIIAFTVLCAVPMLVGFALLYLGAVSFVLTHALRQLFIKYEIVEEQPDVVEDRPWRLKD